MVTSRTTRTAVPIAAVLALAGCGAHETAPDVQAVIEDGDYVGTSARAPIGCMAPSTGDYIEADTAFDYPAGQQVYEFRGDGSDADAPALRLITADDQTVSVSGALIYYLTDDCEVLQDFHTKVGRRNWAGQPAYIVSDVADPFVGWNAMTDTLLFGPLKAASQAEVVEYETLPLAKDPEAIDAFEQAVLDGLPASVREVAGGDYFGRFELRLDPAEPPAETVEALNRRATANEVKAAVEAENETAKTRYQTLTDCKDEGISEQACVVVYGIDSGKVPYLAPAGTVVAPQAGG